MSVIKFSPSEFASFATYAKRDEHSRRAVIYSEKFCREKARCLNCNEEELIDAILDSLFIHLWKANLFCSMAQYPREGNSLYKELKDTKEFPEGEIIEGRVVFLRRLKSLDYNLATNDGNYFVDPLWYDLLQRLIRKYEYIFADEKLYPPNHN